MVQFQSRQAASDQLWYEREILLLAAVGKHREAARCSFSSSMFQPCFFKISICLTEFSWRASRSGRTNASTVFLSLMPYPRICTRRFSP